MSHAIRVFAATMIIGGATVVQSAIIAISPSPSPIGLSDPTWGVLADNGFDLEGEPTGTSISGTGVPTSMIKTYSTTNRAVAAVQATSRPDFAQIAAWAGANVGTAQSNMTRVQFELLPEAGESVGDPVNLFGHYQLVTSGTPNVNDAVAVQLRRVTTFTTLQTIYDFIDFAPTDETQTTPFTAFIGETLLMTLSNQVTDVDSGNRSQDVQLSVTFDSDPPTPPFVIGIPEPAATGLFILALPGLLAAHRRRRQPGAD